MTRRLIVQIALGVAGAFALAVATPVLACDCDKKAGTTADKADKKTAAPAAADKTTPAQQAPAQEKKAEASRASGTLLAAEGGCKCGAKEAKDCKCGEKCHCTDKAGTDKPKTSAAASSTLLLVAADACPCGAKVAADCKCGEKCKCHEKKDAPPKAKAA